MICSSENCFRFICPSLRSGRTLAPNGGKNGGHVTRHKFSDAVGWVTVGEPGERFGQPLMRVDGVELAALDEGGDHRPVVAAFVRAGEERVLALYA